MVEETRTSPGPAKAITRAARGPRHPGHRHRRSRPRRCGRRPGSAGPGHGQSASSRQRSGRLVAPSKTTGTHRPWCSPLGRKLFTSLRRRMLWASQEYSSTRSRPSAGPSRRIDDVGEEHRRDDPFAGTLRPDPHELSARPLDRHPWLITHHPGVVAGRDIEIIEPGGMSRASPSSMTTCRTPETEWPRWWTWQVRVPMMGARSIDHRQPGSNATGRRWVSPRRTTAASPRKCGPRREGRRSYTGVGA